MTDTILTMKPLRLRVFDLIDVLIVSEPEQIQWLNEQPNVTRRIDGSHGFLHRFLAQRLHEDLSFGGKELPVFRRREDEERAQKQKQLEVRLETMRGAPGEDRDDIAAYVSGHKDVPEIGVTVQHWCGRLFSNRFMTTGDTYEAGRMIAGWASAAPWHTWKHRVTGRLSRAKSLLQAAAEGDLHCVHATSIGMENVTRTVRKLRKAAQRADKQNLSTDEILRECLYAPPALVRGCSGPVSVPFLDHPLTKRSLIVFLVARAYAASGDLDIAFLSDGWSACPARRVVPEMLRAVWQAAHHDEAEAKRLISTINSWSRLWHRAVS
ncbi:MAG TPA: hypothetical protein VJV78_16020 [Polyangiales bacterium]|nr:hypothetical protein [Polyangiales bacterium]